MPQPSISEIRLKITYLKFHSNFPGVNQLSYGIPEMYQPACNIIVVSDALAPNRHQVTSNHPADSSLTADYSSHGPWIMLPKYISVTLINPETSGNAWVCTQYSGCWCLGAKAPGHQHPQCRLNNYCTGLASYRNITVKAKNIRKETYILKNIIRRLMVKQWWKVWPFIGSFVIIFLKG